MRRLCDDMPTGRDRPTAPASLGGRRWRVLAVTASAAALCISALPASAGAASLSWLGAGAGEFPNSNEVELRQPEGQFREPQGIAVNQTTGDVYLADKGNRRVLRFTAAGKFLEGWGWGVGDYAARFERCGPDGEQSEGKPVFPTCPGLDEGYETGAGLAGEGEGEFENPQSVAIDQSTGDVFVADLSNNGLVKEFTAAGEFIQAFGSKCERGCEASQHSANPVGPQGIAVDSSKRVYVMENFGQFGPRVMVFEPSGGEYKYSKGIFSNLFEFEEGYLSITDSGSFFLRGVGHLYRFDSATATTPAWEHAVGEASGITANPKTGEIYYYSAKQNTYHVLKPEGKTGASEETFQGATNEKTAIGAAFNPLASVGGRAPGVLYTDEPHDGPTKQPSRGMIFAGPHEEVVEPPLVGEGSLSALGTTSVTLEGVVNPKGRETTYWFEYGTVGKCSEKPCTKAPAEGASAGHEEADKNVSVGLDGLQSGTTYYYRLVASSRCHPGALEEPCVVHGADQQFHTFPLVSGLPDGRAYELVTPIEKNGGEIYPIDGEKGSCQQCEPGLNVTRMAEQSAPDGKSVVYEGSPFFSRPQGGVGAVSENEYRAVWTESSGWQTTDLSPELQSNGTGSGFRAFTPDLTSAIFSQQEPALVPGVPDVWGFIYRWDAPGGFMPLTTEVEPGLHVIYSGATSDLSRIVFAANGALTAGAPVPANKATERDLYEWSAGGLRLVSVLPNGKSEAGVTLGSGEELNNQRESAPDYTNAVSADGAKIFWSSEATGQVYVRENGATTTMIPDKGKFVMASADGTRVLLSDGQLYLLPEKLKLDLTGGQGGFEGILGASRGLSNIYFVDTAKLTNDEEPGPAKTFPTTGADNLYYYEGATSSVRFIATLASKDNELHDVVVGDWKAAPADRPAQVTPDGRYLAFQSFAALVPGQPTHSAGCEANECSEVYVYDAASNDLKCVSCSGLPPSGPSYLPLMHPVGLEAASPGFPQPKYLTPEGRLFFDSQDVLSAADTRPGIEHVYEFERAGQGSCTEPAGCVQLLTSGSSSQDAAFFDASESGGDVFVTTRAQLLPKEDHDELVDLYDVREQGGRVAPVEPPVEAPAPCSGEGCRPQPEGGPLLAGIPSIGFTGAGNLPPPPPPAASQLHATATKCPKGKVLQHKKCVKKRRKSRCRGKKPRCAAKHPHRKGKKASKTGHKSMTRGHH